MSFEGCAWESDIGVKRRFDDVADWTESAPTKRKGSVEKSFVVWLDSSHLRSTYQSSVESAPDSSKSWASLTHLAEEWKKAMELSSSVTEMILHPAYQRIIGHGPAAVPFLIEQVRTSSLQWFPALMAITGVDPVAPDDRGRIKAMRQAWIKWASEAGVLH